MSDYKGYSVIDNSGCIAHCYDYDENKHGKILPIKLGSVPSTYMVTDKYGHIVGFLKGE